MRDIRRWARLTAYCLLVALQPLLTGCETPPPEAALREAVAELESGLEGGDVGAVMDRLAADFRYRDLDRKAAGRRLVGVDTHYLRIGYNIIYLRAWEKTEKKKNGGKKKHSRGH